MLNKKKTKVKQKYIKNIYIHIYIYMNNYSRKRTIRKKQNQGEKFKLEKRFFK